MAKNTKQTKEPAPKSHECPNCLTDGLTKPRDACALEALASILVDREVAEPEAVMAWLARQDADEWWDEIGPVVDAMESAFVKAAQEDAERPEMCEACADHPCHVSDRHQINCSDAGKTMCADHHVCDGEGC